MSMCGFRALRLAHGSINTSLEVQHQRLRSSNHKTRLPIYHLGILKLLYPISNTAPIQECLTPECRIPALINSRIRTRSSQSLPLYTPLTQACKDKTLTPPRA